MLIIPPRKSNVQRQREFRQRNPGYYGRLHRKRKAEAMALQAARLAVEVTMKAPLMLPAPSEELRIPGVNAIPTRAEFEAMRAMAAIETSVVIPQD